jgi:hypothetical protein
MQAPTLFGSTISAGQGETPPPGTSQELQRACVDWRPGRKRRVTAQLSGKALGRRHQHFLQLGPENSAGAQGSRYAGQRRLSCCHFLKALRDRGVPVVVGRVPAHLEYDGKRVTGVVMESGDRLKCRKGVVLATGGYDANQQMAEESKGLPGLEQDPSSLIPDSMTGDAILFGAEIGAVVHRIDNSLRVMLAYTIP